MARLKIIVDRDLCETNGLCTEVAPRVFEIDADDNLRVLHVEPAESELGPVKEAVRRCPKGALALQPLD